MEEKEIIRKYLETIPEVGYHDENGILVIPADEDWEWDEEEMEKE